MTYKQMIKPLIIGIILSAFTLCLLSAQTSEQNSIIDKLQERFGKVETCLFDSRTGNVINHIDFAYVPGKISDTQSAKEKADSMLKYLGPYFRMDDVTIDSVSIEAWGNSLPKAYSVTLFQKLPGNFTFERTIPRLSLYMQINNHVTVKNSFIYDFKLPKPPYISKDLALEIADSTYWQDLIQYRQEHPEILQDIHRYPDLIHFFIYQSIDELKLLHDSDDLTICYAYKSNKEKIYRLAYRISYNDGYLIKVDAKTGNVLYHMNTRAY